MVAGSVGRLALRAPMLAWAFLTGSLSPLVSLLILLNGGHTANPRQARGVAFAKKYFKRFNGVTDGGGYS